MAAPLTNDDLTAINTALKAITETKKVIARAKVAGIDVSTQETAVDESEARLKGIKAGFFPNGRT